MQLSTLILAVLPALALAQESSYVAPGAPTTTVTTVMTTHLTKTISLSRVHTVTSYSTNSTTTSCLTTGGTTSWSTPSTTGVVPTTTKGPENAGSALEAGKMILVGVAGMVAVAMM